MPASRSRQFDLLELSTSMDSNWPAVIIFVALALLFLRMARVFFRSSIAPMSLYTGLWFLSLALFYTGAIVYDDLEAATLVIFLLVLSLFVLGAVIARALVKPAPAGRKQDLLIAAHQAEPLFRLTLGLFLVGLAGTVAYYLQLASLIGLDALLSDPRLVRYEQTIGDFQHAGWSSLASACIAPAAVLAVISLRLGMVRHRKWMLLIFVASVLVLVPSAGRTALVSLVIWAGLAVLYIDECREGAFSFRKYRLYLLGGAGLLVAYFLITTGLLSKGIGDDPLASSAVRLPPGISALADVIHYAVGNFPAFQALVQVPADFVQPASLTFGFLSRIWHEVDPAAVSLPEYIQPFVNVPLSTNVYTYLDSYYLDFGWIGVVIFPFLTGLTTTLLYLWMKRSPSVMNIYIVSLMGYCILETTTANRFGTFETFIRIIIPLVALKLLEGLGRDPSLSQARQRGGWVAR